MEPLSAPTWKVGFLTVQSGTIQHPGAGGGGGTKAPVCFPQGHTGGAGIHGTQRPSNQKPFWREFRGHQEANLDPSWLTCQEGTEKEQENHVGIVRRQERPKALVLIMFHVKMCWHGSCMQPAKPRVMGTNKGGKGGRAESNWWGDGNQAVSRWCQTSG